MNTETENTVQFRHEPGDSVQNETTVRGYDNAKVFWRRIRKANAPDYGHWFITRIEEGDRP